MKAPFYLVATLWVIILFSPQWAVASQGVRVFLIVPVLMFPVVAAFVGLAALPGSEWGRRLRWFWPYAFWIGVVTVTVPFATNRGIAWQGLQIYLMYFPFMIALAAFVDTARRAELMLYVFAFQFFWFALWGFAGGPNYAGVPGMGVRWDPTLSNSDGFGAWMVVGAGFCAFMFRATDNKRLERALQLIIALAVVCVIGSYARGAFLISFAAAGLVWWRSPNKGRMLAAGIGCGLLILMAAYFLFGDAYWNEMSTILEGTEESTGEERWETWKAAWVVFLKHPLFGAGSGNWSIYGAVTLRAGDFGGMWGNNPAMLWGMQAHNIYVQTMGDHGIAGLVALGWLIVDFWRRNLALRTPAAEAYWQSIGGRMRLRFIALAMEAAFVALLCACSLYTVGNHWWPTILAMNFMMHSLVVSGRPGAPRARRPLYRAEAPSGSELRPSGVVPT